MRDADITEIISSFRAAKRPVVQIKILADLHCATVSEIENILVMQGIILPEKPLPKKRKSPEKITAKKQAVEARNLMIIEMMTAGCSMAKIARKLGTSATTIGYHVSKLRAEKRLPPTRRMSMGATCTRHV